MIRRGFIGALAVLLAVGLLVVLPGGGLAQQKVAKIGMSFPLTGADADSADSITKGAQLAIDEINSKGGVAGYKLESVIFDSAHPGGRPVRSGPGGDEHPEVRRRRGGRGLDRPADERRGQGDVADPFRGRPGHDHAQLDEPRHHRPEVPRPSTGPRARRSTSVR